MQKILIIEDDPMVRSELTKLLETHSFLVDSITDFSEVVQQVKAKMPQLILLDVNLPGENGFVLCKELNQQLSIPVLFVTSRTTDLDELDSILSGGDDFIAKPYHSSILLEKIKRTLQHNDPVQFKEIMVKDVVLDLHFSLLKYQGREVELTRNEFKIMYYLFLHPDQVVFKDDLIEYLWNDKFYVDENILNVNIARIRKKLEDIGVFSFIRTIHGKGYEI